MASGGITQVRAALETVGAAVEMHRCGEALTGYKVRNADIPLSELGVLLAYVRKALKPKVSNKGRYLKGRSYEYELRDHFTEHGLACRRVMQSGGGVEKDDLVLTTGWNEEYRLEAKRVAKLPAYLINPQCQATVFRMDKGESLVLTTLTRFTELVQCR